MRVLTNSLLITLVCLSLGIGAVRTPSQDKKTTDVRVEGHVYEPAKLEPTDERIAQLKSPAGFRIHRFAELQNPRMIAIAADGTIYVTQREPGTLTMLRDTNNDGIADVQKVVAKWDNLHGLALHNGKMYLVSVKEVLVADIKPDGTLGPLQTIIKDLPDGGQHPNRTLAIGPADGMLYITVGSTCNACGESRQNPELATVLRAS